MTRELIAFFGSAKIKQHRLDAVEAHRKADEIAQGAYVSNREDGTRTFCGIGCIFHDPAGGHERFETELGIPEALAHLEDALFENMAPKWCTTWPGEFLAAIPVGADLSLVVPAFLAWLMADLEPLAVGNGDMLRVLGTVGALCQWVADGESVPQSEWDAAGEAAGAVRDQGEAAGAAMSTRRLAQAQVARVALAAVWAADRASGVGWAVRNAARAAEGDADDDVGRDRAYGAIERMASILLKLLAAAPVPGEEVTA